VLLPFADYSSGDDVISVYARSRNVTEALTDRFVDKGFKMPIQEDVTQYLVDTNIIRLPPQDRNLKLKEELDGEWSDVMKGEFEKWIEADKEYTASMSGGAANPANAPGVHGLNKMSVSCRTRPDHRIQPAERAYLGLEEKRYPAVHYGRHNPGSLRFCGNRRLR
jgi:hypothetical protein